MTDVDIKALVTISNVYRENIQLKLKQVTYTQSIQMLTADIEKLKSDFSSEERYVQLSTQISQLVQDLNSQRNYATSQLSQLIQAHVVELNQLVDQIHRIRTELVEKFDENKTLQQKIDSITTILNEREDTEQTLKRENYKLIKANQSLKQQLEEYQNAEYLNEREHKLQLENDDLNNQIKKLTQENREQKQIINTQFEDYKIALENIKSMNEEHKKNMTTISALKKQVHQLSSIDTHKELTETRIELNSLKNSLDLRSRQLQRKNSELFNSKLMELKPQTQIVYLDSSKDNKQQVEQEKYDYLLTLLPADRRSVLQKSK
ncbi:Hypothetical_protein [Hexamita inflata]|uniref:Hypothetical_protein n=1 Tax=Hexamita inflata TaxID=28002 RepID=A0AA86TXA6_9EUKA|nr:Hypothetical protein HINF_LOCUS12138 [Hexamita inflata]